jgi:UDP-N-acetyl-D-mannosaminuronate dehydrogenase
LNESSAQEEIVFSGVAYKKGTSQITESQQLRLAVALAQAGRKVRIIEIQEVINQVNGLYPGMFALETTSCLANG